MKHRLSRARPALLTALLLILAGAVYGQGVLNERPSADAGHSDPFAGILLTFGLVMVTAMVGRTVAAWARQPEVLGELVIGVIVGNVVLWMGGPLAILIMNQTAAGELFGEVWRNGRSVADAAQVVFSSQELSGGGAGAQLLEVMVGPHAAEYTIMAVGMWIFSNLGVILLLFMAGLESSVGEMMRVGRRALIVALVGVAVPFMLGYGAGRLLMPGPSTHSALFLGATLCATSVGITARVFRDLGKLATREARMILGAAVIDDVLGLVILALVVGLVSTGHLPASEIVRLLALAAVFLGGVVLVGERLVRSLIASMRHFEGPELKVLFPLVFAFVLSWLADQIELASIVGAFAAGLLLSESHFAGPGLSSQTIKELVKPLELVFAPIFFVLMGMQVNLAALVRADTLLLAAAFIAAAVVGKLVAGLPAGRRLDSLSVGIGMVPRGEVGLIFASIGRGLGVLDDATFSAVITMVIVTTLIAPIGLKWSLARAERASAAS